MFGPHLNKLDMIRKNLSVGKYADAEKNIKAHLNSELKGSAILANLKAPILEYERLLRSIYSDLEDLKDPNQSNKLLMRKKSLGELELAKQQLHDLHAQIEQLADIYFRK